MAHDDDVPGHLRMPRPVADARLRGVGMIPLADIAAQAIPPEVAAQVPLPVDPNPAMFPEAVPASVESTGDEPGAHETRHYADGSSASGPGPLPALSPDEQESAHAPAAMGGEPLDHGETVASENARVAKLEAAEVEAHEEDQAREDEQKAEQARLAEEFEVAIDREQGPRIGRSHSNPFTLTNPEPEPEPEAEAEPPVPQPAQPEPAAKRKAGRPKKGS